MTTIPASHWGIFERRHGNRSHHEISRQRWLSRAMGQAQTVSESSTIAVPGEVPAGWRLQGRALLHTLQTCLDCNAAQGIWLRQADLRDAA